MGTVKILIVDDDRALRDALRRALVLGGYDTVPADSGEAALAEVTSGAPDAVVLDIGLPDIDGLEVCRRLRGAGNRVPVLMLTARDAVSDRIDGLDAGADDYLVKPFDVGELRARLRALLRRTRSDGDGDADGQSFHELRLDGTRHGVGVGESFVELTRTEYQLLELLMLNAGRVLPHNLDLRARVGLRLRPGVERAPRLHRLPAAQARTGGGAPAAPHRARCGLRPARAVSLRMRIAAAAAGAVAVVVLVAAAAIYFGVRAELRGEVDSSLRDRAALFVELADGPRRGDGAGRPRPGCRRTESGATRNAGLAPRRRPAPRPEPFGGPEGVAQIVLPSGQVLRRPGTNEPIPVDERAREVAARGSGEYLTDTTVNGTHLRVLTRGAGDQGAVQLARPLDEVDRQLDRVVLVLLLVGAAGVALGAALGALVARTALSPVVSFTRRTEELAAEGDTSQRIHTERTDELGRLARTFNATLDALERSVEAQRHLVADASHELRTPIASLRANIQTLEQSEQLPEAERASLRADILEELDELTSLVADIVELARGAKPGELVDDVQGGRDRGAGGGARPGESARRRDARRGDGAHARARRASAHPARHLEPRGQRAQVEPAGRQGRDPAGRRRPERARPRARVRRGRHPARVRALLPR